MPEAPVFVPVYWRCRRGVRGFTLLELVVVLVIVSVGLVLVAPRFSGALVGLELKGAARDVASGLRYARGRAIATGRETRLALDVDTGRYWIDGDPRERSLPNGVDLRLVVGRSEVFNDGVGAITFFPDGSSTGGRVILSVDERQFRVDVHWLTGGVRVDDE